MKKDYQKPEVEKIDMVVEHFLATSPNDNQIPIGGEGSGTDPDAAGSRRGEWGNVWSK